MRMDSHPDHLSRRFHLTQQEVIWLIRNNMRYDVYKYFCFSLVWLFYLLVPSRNAHGKPHTKQPSVRGTGFHPAPSLHQWQFIMINRFARSAVLDPPGLWSYAQRKWAYWRIGRFLFWRCFSKYIKPAHLITDISIGIRSPYLLRIGSHREPGNHPTWRMSDTRKIAIDAVVGHVHSWNFCGRTGAYGKTNCVIDRIRGHLFFAAADAHLLVAHLVGQS